MGSCQENADNRILSVVVYKSKKYIRKTKGDKANRNIKQLMANSG